jgi:hypothetical protein
MNKKMKKPDQIANTIWLLQHPTEQTGETKKKKESDLKRVRENNRTSEQKYPRASSVRPGDRADNLLPNPYSLII